MTKGAQDELSRARFTPTFRVRESAADRAAPEKAWYLMKGGFPTTASNCGSSLGPKAKKSDLRSLQVGKRERAAAIAPESRSTPHTLGISHPSSPRRVVAAPTKAPSPQLGSRTDSFAPRIAHSTKNLAIGSAV